jgi:hypothetical protein
MGQWNRARILSLHYFVLSRLSRKASTLVLIVVSYADMR